METPARLPILLVSDTAVPPNGSLDMSIIFHSITTVSNTKESLMKITIKGQVTIPQHIRERHGFLPGTEVHFVDDGDEVRLVKGVEKPRRGPRLVAHMRGRADTRMTTDEIMALTPIPFT